MPLFLAILGLDIRGLPCLSAIQGDLYIGGLAETEEALRRRIESVRLLRLDVPRAEARNPTLKANAPFFKVRNSLRGNGEIARCHAAVTLIGSTVSMGESMGDSPRQHFLACTRAEKSWVIFLLVPSESHK